MRPGEAQRPFGAPRKLRVGRRGGRRAGRREDGAVLLCLPLPESIRQREAHLLPQVSRGGGRRRNRATQRVRACVHARAHPPLCLSGRESVPFRGRARSQPKEVEGGAGEREGRSGRGWSPSPLGSKKRGGAIQRSHLPGRGGLTVSCASSSLAPPPPACL